jgi:peptidoglycan/xylan/chitin deacetylase (PgdA/CDA1 family)
MKLNSLMYHAIEAARTECRYSFSLAEFKSHLAALRAAVGGAPAVPVGAADMSGFAVTFDDGHVGWLQAAEALDALQWKASFFVVTGLIGTKSSVNRSDIKRLAEMGHVIGSHSADHPRRLSGRDDAFILDQWRRSKAVLEDILGREVANASVPGGYYSARVARAAEAAGIRNLFTSEPVATSWNVGRCRVLGRFVLTNEMTRERIARIAVGARGEHARQYCWWNCKKAVKSVALAPYLSIRGRLHRLAQRMPRGGSMTRGQV